MSCFTYLVCEREREREIVYVYGKERDESEERERDVSYWNNQQMEYSCY